MGLMREGRGWMFLSGLLFGMGIMLIIWAATPKTKLIYPDIEISDEGETINVSAISTTQQERP
jgi:hypothetical protein